MAGIMHSDATIKTYTDFGQNKGRYVVGNTNALLDYLNADGVKITYTGGQADYTLEHGMIDFGSQVDIGYAAVIGYNFTATVAHNYTVNGTISGNDIGKSNAIVYRSIEAGSYVFTASQDYRISRQNKLVTDVTGSVVYGSQNGDYSDITNYNGLAGQMIYRAGSGSMFQANYDGSLVRMCGGYSYITGGVMSVDQSGMFSSNSVDQAFVTITTMNTSSGGISAADPLPYAGYYGDSGSPVWIWNNSTGQYEYLDATQSANLQNWTQAVGAAKWTVEVMDSYNVDVNISSTSDNTVYVNGTVNSGETLAGVQEGTTITLWKGTVTDGSGKELASYIGVENGVNTWADLSGIKDNKTWYTYGDSYMNASYSGQGKDLSYGDLFQTQNLVFKASGTEVQNVVLTDTVDLGIGYVQFSKADGAESATFVVTAQYGAD